MLFSFVVSVVRYQVLSLHGLRSSEYTYCYYYSDAILTIFLYFALITLYLHVFDEMKVEKYVRLAAILLLAGTALFSYLVVQQSSQRMATSFVYELSQNLYFVGLVLTYVLWGAILKLRETRTQLIQLVLSLGVYFSAFAATFALENMFPNFQSVAYIAPDWKFGNIFSSAKVAANALKYTPSESTSWISCVRVSRSLRMAPHRT